VKPRLLPPPARRTRVGAGPPRQFQRQASRESSFGSGSWFPSSLVTHLSRCRCGRPRQSTLGLGGGRGGARDDFRRVFLKAASILSLVRLASAVGVPHLGRKQRCKSRWRMLLDLWA